MPIIRQNKGRSSALDVPRGLVHGVGQVNKFGDTENVGTTFEEVWDGAVPYTGYLSSGATVSAVSADADDDDGGAGAQTISITGIEEGTGDEVTEILTMNGQSATAETTTLFTRVYRCKVENSGASDVNEGDITITAGATVMAIIQAGNGQTLMALYTVPAGRTAYLSRFYANVGKSADATVEIYAKPSGKSWNLKGRYQVFESGLELHPDPYPKFEAGTDLKIMAASSTAATEVSAGFDLYLEQN